MQMLKRSQSLRIGFGLASATLVLQLHVSVAHGTAAASLKLGAEPAIATEESAPRQPIRIAAQTAQSSSSNSTPTIFLAAGSQSDPLSVLDASPMTDNHRALARAILGLLPVECQSRLHTFSVLYDRPEFRGAAGRGTIIMNGALSDTRFVTLLLHEGLGHFWDLTCVTGTDASGSSAFSDGKKKIEKDDPSTAFYSVSWASEKKRLPTTTNEDFVSVYARSDAFEDLAESVTYYLLQRDAFEKRANSNAALNAKLDWLRANFPITLRLTAEDTWSGSMPADAAKGDYAWVGNI